MTNELDYFINHIFLPPKLPQKHDSDAAREHALCVFMRKCTNQFLSLLPASQKKTWAPSFRFLGHLCDLYENDALAGDFLEGKLRHLGNDGMSVYFQYIGFPGL